MLYYNHQMMQGMPTERVCVYVGNMPTMGFNMPQRFAPNMFVQPNPTLAHYLPSQPQPQGFHPQPTGPAPSARRVTRHNPYATASHSSAAATNTTTTTTEAPISLPLRMPLVPTESALAFVMPRQLQQAMQMTSPSPLPSMDTSVSDLSNLKRGHNAFVATEELLAHAGTLADISRTAHGSSFVQSALRDGCPHLAQNVQIGRAHV